MSGGMSNEAFEIKTEVVLQHTWTKKNVPSLKCSIDGLRNKKRRIIKKMRVISQQLRQSLVYDPHKIEEYQALNEELRRVRIFDAELTHLRNML